MPFEITVGEPKLALHQGNSVLVTDRDGGIRWPSDNGLYFYDTRLLSSWQIYVNGESLRLLSSAPLSHFVACIFLTNGPLASEQGRIPGKTISVDIGRSISGGVHEDIEGVNHGMQPVRFNLEIAIRSDFANIFEVKSRKSVRRGHIETEWLDAETRLRTTYRNRDFGRAIMVTAKRSGSAPVYANGRITFDVRLDPHASWHTCLLYELGDGNRCFEAPPECISEVHRSDAGRRLKRWH